jgi:hypothetical protein
MRYDVCLSYASEDREYVSRVADALRSRKVRVFYDKFETSKLWGKNLYTHLDEIYRTEARFCVMFISRSYAEKTWAKHERESAQARALEEFAEYILPARFDDTVIPGLRRTVGYVSLNDTTPEELADLICQKLQDSLFAAETSIDRPGIDWMTGGGLTIDGINSSVLTFQHVPIKAKATRLEELIAKLVSKILEQTRVESGRVYWSHGQDRRFDQVYATTSALYSLCQLGVSHDLPVLRRAIDGLKEIVTPSAEDRAGVIFLTIIGEVSRETLMAFLGNLAEMQLTNETNRRESGSFLLPQGPAPGDKGPANWANLHRDGASFHACHIADALLHIPSDFPECRSAAEPILNGIRSYLTRSFSENEGWLLDLKGETTPLTLYAYALCPALRMPLPANWRDVSAECNRIAVEGTFNVLKRFFGVMNATYAASSLNDSEFDGEAARFVSSQLAALPTHDEIDCLSLVDLAGFLRSIAYGVDWLDRRFMAPVSVRATETITAWDEESNGLPAV